MDGDVGAYIQAQIAKVNLVALDKIWDNGFRQITTSTKPINTPEDLRGFKIRVPVSPMWTSMFKAFDSAPASINASEMYTALQTKVVDGQENPAGRDLQLQALRSAEVLLDHQPHVGWVLDLVNRRAWDRLPANVRDIAAKHLNAAAVNERADVASLNTSLQQDLVSRGIVFNTPKTDAFRDKLHGPVSTASGRPSSATRPGP